MDLDQHFLVFLALDWPKRTDGGPIEDPEVVKVAFRTQQLAFTQRLALFHFGIGNVAQKFGLCMLSSQ